MNDSFLTGLFAVVIGGLVIFACIKKFDEPPPTLHPAPIVQVEPPVPAWVPPDPQRELRCPSLQINIEKDTGLSAEQLQEKSLAWNRCMGIQTIEWCELAPAMRQQLLDMGAKGRDCP